MIVCLTSLASLLESLEQPPRHNPDAARELWWEARVFNRAVAAVSAHDATNADPVTAAELLGLAAQVADQLVSINGSLADPAPLSGLDQQDVLQAVAITTGAACEVAHGLLGLLQLPFLHDTAIGQRLAAASVVALSFAIPRAAVECGLASGLVIEVVAGAVRRAVELATQSHVPSEPAFCLRSEVCRPGALHAFLQRAVEALQAGAPLAAGMGSREWQKAREHLACTVHHLMGEDLFQQEAQRVLVDGPLVRLLLLEVTRWHLVGSMQPRTPEARSRPRSPFPDLGALA